MTLNRKVKLLSSVSSSLLSGSGSLHVRTRVCWVPLELATSHEDWLETEAVMGMSTLTVVFVFALSGFNKN